MGFAAPYPGGTLVQRCLSLARLQLQGGPSGHYTLDPGEQTKYEYFGQLHAATVTLGFSQASGQVSNGAAAVQSARTFDVHKHIFGLKSEAPAGEPR